MANQNALTAAHIRYLLVLLPAMKGSLLLHLINDACVVALVVWFWMPIVTRLFAGWLKKA